MQKNKQSKLQNFNIYSDVVEEVLSTPPNLLLRSGNFIILSFILILFGLAWFIKFPDTVVSTAIITTSKSPIKILAQSTGILNTLNVIDNQYIQKDSIIAVITINEQFDDINILENYLKNIENNLEHTDQRINELDNLKLGELTSKVARLLTLLNQYNILTKKITIEKEIKQYKKQLTENNKIQQTINTERQYLSNKVDLIQKNHNRQINLFKDGVISEYDLELSESELFINKTAVVTLDRRKQENNASIQAIKRQIVSLESNEKRSISEVEFEIQEVTNQLLADIYIWKNKHVIISPINGICSYHSFIEENQYIKEGQELFYISPDSLNYEIRGVLPFEKSGLVKPKNQVIVKLPQYPYQEFGTFLAEINRISYTPNDDGYIFIAKLKNKNQSSYSKSVDFKPLMPAQVEIIIEDSRLLERVFYEIKNIFIN